MKSGSVYGGGNETVQNYGNCMAVYKTMLTLAIYAREFLQTFSLSLHSRAVSV